MLKQSLIKIFDKLMGYIVDYSIVILYLATIYLIWRVFNIHPFITLPLMAYIMKYFVKS